ncbi:glycine betaine ABC transporter substrate-binding protein [Jannaschia rubra]|uniref:glycine betaine ABC transporter substrate-binding protein n=1 Tax=Jannaschia rubra TaxID=282197 RepID=UPI0031E571FF
MEIFQHGSGETLATSMASAVENGEPTSLIGKYDMTQADLGPFDEEAWACTVDATCEDAGMTAYASTPVITVVTTTFGEDHPELAASLSKLTFANARMSEVLAWQKDNSATAEAAAVHFLTACPDVWPAWLDDAVRGNLAGLID